MLGIGAPHPYKELGSEWTLALWEDNDPPVVLPIGNTPMGFYIVLVLEEADDYGQVLLRTFEEFYYLADNMRSFFELLKPDEE
jgi:hypothetical protein